MNMRGKRGGASNGGARGRTPADAAAALTALRILLPISLLGLLLSVSPAVAQSLSVQPAAAQPPAAQSSLPTYTAVRCCELCPQAANPDNYAADSYSRSFRLLQEGKPGWLFRSGFDLSTEFGLTDKLYREMRRFNDALKARGVDLVLVYLPPRGLADSDKLSAAVRATYDYPKALANYGKALQQFQSLGKVVTPRLDQLMAPDKGYEFYFRRDHHWSPSGAQHVARAVAESVQQLPIYAVLPKRPFETTRVGAGKKQGSIASFARRMCGFTDAPQFVDVFSTAAAGEGDLLGETPAPWLVLIGTSNSVGDAAGFDYNFLGALEQNLSLDVLNQSVTGGGFDTAMLQYLLSEEFLHNPPKLIIWEMPYYDFISAGAHIENEGKLMQFFRQAVPLVSNGCSGRKALLKNQMQLHAGTNRVLFNGGSRILPLSGKQYRMDLQFSDPNLKSVPGQIWYYNGKSEALRLQYNERIAVGGRFVMELDRDEPGQDDSSLMALHIELPAEPATPLTLQAQVCASDKEASHVADAR